jgi:hypothetical protein
MDELFGGNKTVNPNKPSELRRLRRVAKEKASQKEESQRKSVPRSPGPLSRKKQGILEKKQVLDQKQAFEDMIIAPWDDNTQKKQRLQAEFDRTSRPAWASELNDYEQQLNLYVTEKEIEHSPTTEINIIYAKIIRQQKYYIQTLFPNKADTPAELERKKEKLLKLISWMGDMNEPSLAYYKSILDIEFLELLTKLVNKFDLADEELKSVLPKEKNYHPLFHLRMSNNNSILVYIPSRIGNLIGKYLYGDAKPKDEHWAIADNTQYKDKGPNVGPKGPPMPPKPPSEEPEPEPRPFVHHHVHTVRPTSSRSSPSSTPTLKRPLSYRDSSSSNKRSRSSPAKAAVTARSSPAKAAVAARSSPAAVADRSSPLKQYVSTNQGSRYRFTHNSPRVHQFNFHISPRVSPRIPKTQYQAPNGPTEDGVLLHAKKVKKPWSIFNVKGKSDQKAETQAKQVKKPWSMFNVFTKKSDAPKKKGWFSGGRTRRSNRR